MNYEPFLLANAYVDGELNELERGIAESDREVLHEIVRLSDLTARIKGVEPSSDANRERAISVALEGFVSQRNSAVFPRSVEKGPSSNFRLLRFAAVAIALGAFGTFIANNFANDKQSKAGMSFTAEAVQESEGIDAAAASFEAAIAADSSNVAGVAATVDEVANESSSEALAASRIQFDPTMPLTSPTELADYVYFTLGLIASREAPPTPETRCLVPDADIISSATYVLTDEPIDVLIAHDPLSKIAYAVDVDTCVVLVQAPVP